MYHSVNSCPFRFAASMSLRFLLNSTTHSRNGAMILIQGVHAVVLEAVKALARTIALGLEFHFTTIAKHTSHEGFVIGGIAAESSAGIGIDGIDLFKQVGKVSGLKALVDNAEMDKTKIFDTWVSIARTRWATHRPPRVINCHPLSSDKNEFIVVHNGIVTNSNAIKTLLQKRGYVFESETDRRQLLS
ncbi:hypothetical protein M422DRAFT_778129 [Sphaerobolus stellatus SS14]|nr:hypothetical protein M422DRAFT_778129 [Sphaerobolus stellatus SS14]